MKMRKRNKWFGSIAGVFASLVISSTALAAELPAENRLPFWGEAGSPTVSYTNIDINFKNGKKKKGITDDSVFFAESTDLSTFSLDGPGFPDFGFDGYMAIDAKLSSRGRLRTGETDNRDKVSTFGIYSTNTALFGTGNEATYNCNKGGSNCTTGQLVFGGDLASFGWSSAEGVLEFTTANLSGWAVDTWLANDPLANRVEHLILYTLDEFGDRAGFDLGGVSSVKAFTATANGFAVVPVPAAVWLFGTGLIGLVGFARRKRV